MGKEITQSTLTYQETSSNKHRQLHGGRLDDDSDNHDDTASKDTGAATEPVGDVRDNWESNKRTDRHDGVQQTQGRCGRVVEVC
jgi:hypothetical protein